MVILGWPLKRVIIARLKDIADGTTAPPAGAELLVATPDKPVLVSHMVPPEPDRITVYGSPLRATFDEVTAESPTQVTETSQIELKVRVYDPGDDEPGLSIVLADICQAVTAAVLAVAPTILPSGRIWLAQIRQDASTLAPGPQPSIVESASLFFRAEAVAYGG